MTGLGGDAFVLLKPAGAEHVIALNGSGTAPMGLDAADMRTRGLTAVPLRGIESVTLPGAVDTFCRLSADWGRLDPSPRAWRLTGPKTPRFCKAMRGGIF